MLSEEAGGVDQTGVTEVFVVVFTGDAGQAGSHLRLGRLGVDWRRGELTEGGREGRTFRGVFCLGKGRGRGPTAYVGPRTFCQ